MAAWWEISRTSEARLKWLSALPERAEDESRFTYLGIPLRYLSRQSCVILCLLRELGVLLEHCPVLD
jgi:hypothetical protein